MSNNITFVGNVLGLCPACKSERIDYDYDEKIDDNIVYYGTCNDCKTTFEENYEVNYVNSTYEKKGE